MNTESLFKRFDELADLPERIPALRKVILAYLLHSAVNSPDATSRAGTLREVHEIRRREFKKKASRKEVLTVPEVTDEDLPPSLSDIPTALFDRLGNIASIEKGLSQIQSTTPGKYPLVVTAETRSSSESFDFEGAAAIIPLVSSTGHGDASLKRLHYQEGRYAVGNILAVVKPICPDLLRARFIYEYLSAFKEELLVSRMVGTANVSLTVNKLKEVPVPLVSGPVLSRIDELMALCDRLEAQQQERETRHAALARASLARFADAPTPANLNFLFHPLYTISPADLRKSILTLAVQGKLVPQDPNDETAEGALRKCGVDTKRWRVAEEERRHGVPKSWIWIRFAGVGEQRLGKMLDAQKNRGKLKPYLRNTNVQWMHFELDDVKEMRVEEREEKELRLKRGDLLICEGGEPGRCAIWRDEVTEMYFQKALHRVRPCDEVLSEFLALNLQIDCRNDVLAGYFTGATIKHLTGRSLSEYSIPIPPLAEQRRIVDKVEQLMALVDELEAQLATSRATAANLLSALVAEFTGSPNNRHASVSPTTGSGRRGRPRKT